MRRNIQNHTQALYTLSGMATVCQAQAHSHRMQNSTEDTGICSLLQQILNTALKKAGSGWPVSKIVCGVLLCSENWEIGKLPAMNNTDLEELKVDFMWQEAKPWGVQWGLMLLKWTWLWDSKSPAESWRSEGHKFRETSFGKHHSRWLTIYKRRLLECLDGLL